MRNLLPVFTIMLAITGTIISGCVPANQESSVHEIQDPAPDNKEITLNQISSLIGLKINNPQYPGKFIIDSKAIKAHASLPLIYRNRNYQPLWIDENGPRPQAYEMIDVIKDSYREGLNPNSYCLTEIDYELNRIQADKDSGGPVNSESLAELDLLLSNSYLSYAQDVLYGQVTPEQINIELIFGERRIDLSDLLVTAVNQNNVRETINGLFPKYPVYDKLRTALERYRKLAADGGWEPIPQGPKFKKGARGPRVTALKERLLVTGEIDSSALGNDAFDSTLDQAVRKYQERNGLYVDGVVGESTLAALNIPAEERVRQIELTMERWRLLPQSLGTRYILVNIANFHLYAVENNNNALTMRIVVGKPQWNTPIFSEQMTHIVINPYWNIPHSIFRDDIAPKIKSDPDYMTSRNIQAVGLKYQPPEKKEADVNSGDLASIIGNGNATPVEDAGAKAAKEEYISKVLSGNYRLRQNPGPSNPLGRIKFLFPNKHSVYLHDTPNRGYFERAQRNFSHGCIRVEKPVELAEFVLYSDPAWSHEKVRSTINRGKTQTVNLSEPVPVYILYFTAWVDDDGSVNFHEDIYGLDRVLQNALHHSKAKKSEMATNVH
ncbi:MAG: L,D-transpeptidase family protein [Deltaproteobacteria bacterium]